MSLIDLLSCLATCDVPVSLFFKLEVDDMNMDHPPWGQFAHFLYYSLQLVAHALMYHDYIPFLFALPHYTPPCFAHPHCYLLVLAFFISFPHIDVAID
jgi:hypothetical protein